MGSLAQERWVLGVQNPSQGCMISKEGVSIWNPTRRNRMTARHPISNKPILNKPDQDGLYTCQYSGLKVKLSDAIFLGPCTPQVNGTYVCHPTATPEFRKSKRAFDAHEANCNTCEHLERIPHEKCKSGLLLGRCHLQSELKFHPDDYMGMLCYKQRPEKKL